MPLGMDREAWRAVVHGVKKSWTRLSDRTELNWTDALWQWPTWREKCRQRHPGASSAHSARSPGKRVFPYLRARLPPLDWCQEAGTSQGSWFANTWPVGARCRHTCEGHRHPSCLVGAPGPAGSVDHNNYPCKPAIQLPPDSQAVCLFLSITLVSLKNKTSSCLQFCWSNTFSFYQQNITQKIVPNMQNHKITSFPLQNL